MGIGGIVSAIAGLSTLAGAFSGASAAAASGGGLYKESMGFLG